MSTDTIDHALDFQDGQQQAADQKLYVAFFKAAIKNEFRSIQEGRPIFDEIDHIKIMTPGSRDVFVSEANEGYVQRFPTQWARYKANQDQSTSGTPLSALPWMNIGQIAEFNAMNVKTVEQLVGMSDALSGKFMGHHQIKQRAKMFLEAAQDAAPALKLQAELEKRDLEIAELRGMIEAMSAAKKAADKPGTK